MFAQGLARQFTELRAIELRQPAELQETIPVGQLGYGNTFGVVAFQIASELIQTL